MDMKTIVRFWTSAVWMVLMISQPLFAQKVDEQRMQRDIAVAENVLSTLIKQQFEQQRMFFPLEVTASYQPGYGVTFYLPADFTTPIAFQTGGMDDFGGNVMIWSGEEPADVSMPRRPP